MTHALPQPSRSRTWAGYSAALTAGALLLSCGGGGGASTGAAPQRYAYILNNNDTIWTMSEDAANGALSLAGNQVNAGWAPQAMVMDPHQGYLYAACDGSTGGTAQVLGYGMTGSDHRPAPLAFSAPTALGAGSLAMAPSGGYLYVGGSTGLLTFKVASGGGLSQVGGAVACGHGITNLAVDPSGHYLYAISGYAGSTGTSDDTIRVFALNGATGVPSDTGKSYATGSNPFGIIVHPGTPGVYVTNMAGSISQYIRAADGSLTPKDPLTTPVSPYRMDVALDPSGHHLYVAAYSAQAVQGYTIQGDGTLASMGAAVDAHDTPQSLAVDPDGKFLITTNYNNSVTAFRIDGGTGQLTYVGKSPMGGDGRGILIK